MLCLRFTDGAWKHMAITVYIQTMCQVYTPKACGSWKCWTHHTCSIAYLGTCKKCIRKIYSARAVRGSEILDRGIGLLNLKFCRERKCISTAYNNSKLVLSWGNKDLTNTACSVVSRATVNISHWKETRTSPALKKGPELSNETVSRKYLSQQPERLQEVVKT